MREFFRDAILTVALLGLVHWFASLQATKRADGVPYCMITYKAAGYDKDGNLIRGWARGYGPCSLQDEYKQA